MLLFPTRSQGPYSPVDTRKRTEYKFEPRASDFSEIGDTPVTGFEIALISTGGLIAIGLVVAALLRRGQHKPDNCISTREVLEALIPAMADIERGHFEHVSYFICEANKSLEQTGIPYRYEATSSLRRSWDVTGAFVDRITVVESTQEAPRP